MKFCPTLLFLVLALAGSVQADIVLVSDDFDGIANGTTLGGAHGWNAKWDGSDATQRDLLEFQSDGLQFDTSSAKRNYHALNGTAFTLSPGTSPITISAEFQFEHAAGGSITSNFNENAFGLMVSTTDQWWSGSSYTTSVSNRGNAIGNRIPVAPWVEKWITHSSLGVNTTTGGLSDWVRMEYALIDNGTNVLGYTNIYNATTGALLSSSGQVHDTGIASGATLYAGFSTGWNNVGDGNQTIGSFSKFSSVNIDNFSVTAAPEPSAVGLVGLLICGSTLVRRRRSKTPTARA